MASQISAGLTPCLLDTSAGCGALGVRKAARYSLIAEALHDSIERHVEAVALEVGGRRGIEKTKLARVGAHQIVHVKPRETDLVFLAHAGQQMRRNAHDFGTIIGRVFQREAARENRIAPLAERPRELEL